jgi:hypothetical protein
MTRLDSHVVDRPTCQAATPAQCSQCTMSYDCHRVRSGRALSWGVVALVLLAALTLLSRVATGI